MGEEQKGGTSWRIMKFLLEMAEAMSMSKMSHPHGCLNISLAMIPPPTNMLMCARECPVKIEKELQGTKKY